MSVLITDISRCTHNLGRILFMSPEQWSVNMEIIGTKTVTTYFSSHTAYHLLFTVIPNNSLTMDTRRFEMWTRFRDVRSLWERLADAHKKLQLHGSLPQFSIAVIFGNRSPQVISERMTTMTLFLNYAISHPVLRQTKVLQDYLEKAVESLEPLDHTTPIAPIQSMQPIASTKGAPTLFNEIEQIPDDEFEVLNYPVPSQHEEVSIPVAASLESRPSAEPKEKVLSKPEPKEKVPSKQAAQKEENFKHCLKDGCCCADTNVAPHAPISSAPTPPNTVASSSLSSPKLDKKLPKTPSSARVELNCKPSTSATSECTRLFGKMASSYGLCADPRTANIPFDNNDPPVPSQHFNESDGKSLRNPVRVYFRTEPF